MRSAISIVLLAVTAAVGAVEVADPRLTIAPFAECSSVVSISEQVHAEEGMRFAFLAYTYKDLRRRISWSLTCNGKKHVQSAWRSGDRTPLSSHIYGTGMRGMPEQVIFMIPADATGPFVVTAKDGTSIEFKTADAHQVGPPVDPATKIAVFPTFPEFKPKIRKSVGSVLQRTPEEIAADTEVRLKERSLQADYLYKAGQTALEKGDFEEAVRTLTGARGKLTHHTYTVPEKWQEENQRQLKPIDELLATASEKWAPLLAQRDALIAQQKKAAQEAKEAAATAKKRLTYLAVDELTFTVNRFAIKAGAIRLSGPKLRYRRLDASIQAKTGSLCVLELGVELLPATDASKRLHGREFVLTDENGSYTAIYQRDVAFSTSASRQWRKTYAIKGAQRGLGLLFNIPTHASTFSLTYDGVPVVDLDLKKPPPVVDIYAASRSAHRAERVAELNELLDTIVIPSMKFDEATVWAVSRYVHQRTKELNPSGYAIDAVYGVKRTADGKKVPSTDDAMLTADQTNVSLRRAYELIAAAGERRLIVEPHAVLVWPGELPTGIEVSADDHSAEVEAIRRKLQRLVVPMFMAESATLETVYKYLVQRTRDLDPDRAGVHMTVPPALKKAKPARKTNPVDPFTDDADADPFGDAADPFADYTDIVGDDDDPADPFDDDSDPFAAADDTDPFATFDGADPFAAGGGDLGNSFFDHGADFFTGAGGFDDGPTVTIRLSGAPIWDILRYVSMVTDSKFRITAKGVELVR